jgi:hypothetical protein
MVSVTLPDGTPGWVVTIKVADVPAVLLGLIVAVTPTGAPATASATVPANPLLRAMTICDSASLPGETLFDAALSAKPPGVAALSFG